MKKKFKIFLIFACVFIFFALIGDYLKQRYKLVFLLTNSIMSKQVVLIQKNASLKNAKGKIVFFDIPFESVYFKKGVHFAKILKCESGDLLENINRKFYCNKEFIAYALYKDSKGREMKDFKFNGIIPKDKVFVIGEHEKSFDSRYWGFLDKQNIKGVEKWSF